MMESNISKALNNFELEAGTIGDILIDGKLMVVANNNALSEEDFSNEYLSHVYKCIRNLYITKQPVDIISVKNECDKLGLNLEMSYFTDLTKFSIGSNFEYKIKLVKELASKRDILHRLENIGQDIGKMSMADIEDEVRQYLIAFQKKDPLKNLC